MKHFLFVRTGSHLTPAAILVVLFCQISCLHAQEIQALKATVLFKGQVASEKDGSPVNGPYEITDGTGKKIKSKTSGGTFQQVLKPGEHYTISFGIPSFYKEPDTINLHPSNSYYEENRRFALRPIKAGDAIDAFTLFETGVFTFLPQSETHLRNIISSLSVNKTLFLALTVSDDIVQPQKGKKKAVPAPKKSKTKGKKGNAPPPPDLVEQRSGTLQSLLDTFPVSIQARVSIKQQKSKTKNNLVVSVAKIIAE